MRKILLLVIIFISVKNSFAQPHIVNGLVGKGTRTSVTLNQNLNPSAGTLIISAVPGAWDGEQVIEPSFFYDSAAGNVKIYYTGSTTNGTANNIGLITTDTAFATLTRYGSTQVIGMGSGGATSNRRAHSSWVGKLGNTYYALANNGYGGNNTGEDRNVYGYVSTDGLTWTSRGIVINKSTCFTSALVGFGNTGVVTDQYNKPVVIHGKYQALVEVAGGPGWETYFAQADSLMGVWTLIQKIPTIQPVVAGMYGGPCCFYVNGTYYAFIHYGSVSGNLPTYLSYAKSTDGINWKVEEAPFKTILATPFPNTDQIADPFLCEINGKVYMIAEYVQNAPTYMAQLRLWVYNGTFLQMIEKAR